MNATGAWLYDYRHLWAPSILAVGLLANRLWWSKRWPTAAEAFRLVISILGIIGTAPMWVIAISTKADAGGLTQFLGAAAISWMAWETSAPVIFGLIRR